MKRRDPDRGSSERDRARRSGCVSRLEEGAGAKTAEDASSEFDVIVINFIGTWKLRCGLVGTRLRAGTTACGCEGLYSRRIYFNGA